GPKSAPSSTPSFPSYCRMTPCFALALSSSTAYTPFDRRPFWAITALPSSAKINTVLFIEFHSTYTTPVDCSTHEHIGSADPYDVGSGVCRRRAVPRRREA